MKSNLFLIVSLPFAVVAACQAKPDSALDEDGGGASDAVTSVGGSTSGPGVGGGFTGPGVGGGSTGSGGPCNTDMAVDDDGDGFSEMAGDCHDCDANVNPAAIEVIGDAMNGGGGMGGYVAADENCNGEIDEPLTVCDQALGANDVDPISGAKAIEICNEVGTGSGWGVVSASYVRANGTADASPALGVGLVPAFGGFAAQQGSTMLGLSSGYVRPVGHPDACDATSCNHNGAGTAPANFPQDVPNCPGASDIYDDIGLELEIKAPSNAKGYSFDFAFMSFEFPEYVCTSFNDQFIALVDPAPMGSINGNISFDSQTNPVSVNIALFDHCDPAFQSAFAQNCFDAPPTVCPMAPNPYCPAGPAIMSGTGFNEWDLSNGSGATGWLVTTAPVDPGQTFKIRFAIWDTGDGSLDSTVFVDNFAWTAEAGTVVGTDPIPDPR